VNYPFNAKHYVEGLLFHFVKKQSETSVVIQRKSSNLSHLVNYLKIGMMHQHTSFICDFIFFESYHMTSKDLQINMMQTKKV